MNSENQTGLAVRSTSEKLKLYSVMAGFFLVYAGSATIVGYHVKYLDAVLGFSSGQIGIITSMGILFGIPFQPFLAKGADLMKYKNTMLACTSLGLIVVYTPLLFPQTQVLMSIFGIAFAMYSVMCIFRTATFSLNDVVVQNHTIPAGIPYGRIRIMGSIGWSTGALVSGLVVNRNLHLFPNTVIAIYAVLGLIQYFIMPKAPGMGLMNQQGQKISILKLIFRKELFPVYIMGGLSELGYSTSGTFLVQFFE